jgi:hypothetical protein
MKKIGIVGLTILCAASLYAQHRTAYPNIPRIDVHTHASDDYVAIEKYLALRTLLLEQYSADLAMWINLGNRKSQIRNIDSVKQVSHNRMLCCFSDYDAARGFQHKPQDLQLNIDKGFIGYKIWYGPYYRRLAEGEKGFPYVNDPANEAVFAEMEAKKILAASMHIADPNGPFGNRTKWCADPVEYWREITAFYEVMQNHPELLVVGAHGLWLVCQDAQIDFLRYLLTRFPNLNVDLAATFQYFDLVSYDNLRDFLINYSDRILFGTDVGRWQDEEETVRTAAAYDRCFRILETDQTVEGGFFGRRPIKGLNLPPEVLEKIYYRNAVRIYPHLRATMIDLGYTVE